MSRQRTLHDLFTHFLAEASHTAMTRYQYENLYNRFVGDVGNLPLEDVTTDVLRDWKLHLTRYNAPSSVRRYLKILAAATRFGAEIGWLPSDPMRTIRKPGPAKPRVRFLSPEERLWLLAACRQSRNPLLHPLVVVALGTGGRKNEVRCLPWSAVDFEHSVVRFVKTKTDLDRAVPLLGEALQLLAELHHQRRPDVRWVFPCPDGRYPTEIESPWRTARARAGLVDFHFHDLRYTYASYLAMSGASLRDIADLLGHKNIQQTLCYTHLMPSHTQDIVQRMHKKFLEGQSPAEGDGSANPR
jgi:integrase